MNILQKVLGRVFPPYKYGILQKEQAQLFNSIISALPDDFHEIKTQTLSAKLYGLDDWKLFPDFKVISMAYGGDTIFKYRRRGQNFKIGGLQIFSTQNKKYENIEILIQDNLVRGLKITESAYQLKEFDLQRIKADNVIRANFSFPASEIEIFYKNLSPEIKQNLNSDDLSEIDFNSRIYYSFYDLEDGNYLAVDKNLNIYSLVHDAKPIVKRLKESFIEILKDLKSGKFDKNEHLDKRYSNTK